MTYVFLTAIVLCTFYSAKSDVIECKPSQSIPVVDSYHWPNNTYLAPNQDCTFEISFNSSSYMKFILTAGNFSEGDTFTITDSMGNAFKKSSDLSLFTAFPPSAITIRVTTGPVSNVTWILSMVSTPFSLENVIADIPIKTGPSIAPTIKEEIFTNVSFVIESTSNVALTLVVSSLPQDLSTLMGTFVYEGKGSTATLIGSLYGAISKPIVSTGKIMTVYPAHSPVIDLYMIFDDYTNIQNFSNYRTGWADRGDRSPVTYFMDASKGPAAVIVGRTPNYLDETYLINATFSNSSATLSVISGGPTTLKDYQLVTYNADTISSYLPQQFPLQLTTFVLEEGTASLVFTGNYTDANWTTARLNRLGFLMTKDFPLPSPTQFVQHTLSSGTTHDFDLKLLHFDKVMNGNSNLTVRVDNAGTQSWPLSSIINQTIQLRAQSIDYGFNLYNRNAKGTKLSFAISEAPQISTTYVDTTQSTSTPMPTTTSSSSTGIRWSGALVLLQCLRMF